MGARRTIEIVEPNTSWPQAFEAIAEDLGAALGDAALRIDHIGSTAVPGLPAKDVIDVQATVRSLDEVSAFVSTLAEMGFEQPVELARDHVPAGGSDLPEDWQKRFFKAQESDGRGINLHVRVAGRANQRYPLLFRDYLRSHPSVAAGYAEIKRQLARHGAEDWELYYDVKDPVCDIIMAAAEAWAKCTGWTV
ncbi:MAG TPA: GrpB family protein [Chloroflexota bacterium]